ncbi:PREDICTED: protein FAR1-RELATED SEQUENCE 1 isoform X2 [Tarenaya hassleriana]|uniref:protein FAR1-RELATED SEQUENCE 1 isoform X2 n=1 Tax=Tarenaya hassleriana TaxID=28532 RepID=UPI00053C7802|nr:PREDICTED: protein FAR1-RELATED SEQUENCE 1 isoform X2 [Tarenaya hassleriana]
MGIDLEMPSGEYHNVHLGDNRHQRRHGDGINLNSVNNLELHEGIEFESKEEAFAIYKEYAMSVGFTTIIKASRRSRMTGKFIDAKFVCTSYGSKKAASSEETRGTASNTEGFNIPQTHRRGRMNRSSLKTDCKACLHVKRRQDGRWVVRTLIKEHNHETFPGQTHSTKGRGFSDSSRARMKKMSNSMLRESGSDKKLEKQYGAIAKEINSRQQLALEDGGVERLLNFFTDMQEENPFFFYAMDISGEQTVRNAFWVDAKGRLDCDSFSDVVSIDTMYIKNQYKLPLVPFIGVNHHGQFLLLGCGLLADDTESEFIWLFRAWLKAMGGRQPRVILTSQNNMLKEAVSEVFSSSRHCFYMWSTLGQMPEKLGHVMRQEKRFVDEINDSIYDASTSEEFEKRWWEVVDKYNLRDNSWLQSLYENREHWVPRYMKDVSLVGMSTGQRSDSVNSHFDKYIQRKTTLKAFLDQYKAIMQGRCEEEAKSDMETLHKQPGLKSPSPFGKQMAGVYTHAMLKKFQVEVLGGVACHPKKESEDGAKRIFRVQDYEQKRAYVVVWNSESSEVSCSCLLFELNGFLCRHAMIVLQMSGILSIPSRYVLKRWTKDAKKREVVEAQYEVAPSRAQRYRDLCHRAFKLSEEASLSEESYIMVTNMLDEAFRKFENMNSSIGNEAESTSLAAQDPPRYEEITQSNAFDANKNSTAESRQVHSLHEVLSIGKQEVWRTTELRSRPSIVVDDYLGAQKLSHGMVESDSITSNRDGYCADQSNIQSLAHPNSLASVPSVHSITRKRLYRAEQSSFRPQAMTSCFNIDDGLQETRSSARQQCLEASSVPTHMTLHKAFLRYKKTHDPS